MKNLLATFVAAAATFGASGCASSPDAAAPIRDEAAPSRAYHASYNLPSHGVALEGYCPVAYFAVDKPVRGNPDFASVHNGVTYYLVSADAKALFDENPEKYVPAYGGWCAFGMAVGDKFPVDPTSFEIVDGRLMVFLKNPAVDALELWHDGVEADLVSRADAHWRKVQG